MQEDRTHDDWMRVGERVRRRIRDELRVNYAEIADRGGPSDTKITRLVENGLPLARPETRRRLSVALEWEADGIDRILRGDEPIVTEPAGGPRAAGVDKLSQRVELLAQIQAGQTTEIEALRLQLAADGAEQTALLRQIVDLLERLPIAPGSPIGDGSHPRADVPLR